jgi:hypothetical protein
MDHMYLYKTQVEGYFKQNIKQCNLRGRYWSDGAKSQVMPRATRSWKKGTDFSLGAV